MPDESELRDLFASASAPNTLDADRIIAKSRARRLPKQLAAGAIGTLAVAGIAVIGVQSIQASPPVSTMGGAAYDSQESSGADESMIKRAPAERINLCEGPVAGAMPSLSGLQLDVVFPESAPATAGPVEGTVLLTNTGSQTVTGTTAARPAITLSQDGTVHWHSNGPMILSVMIVDLEPGASMEYAASFEPVRCSVEDDLQESFRPDLPVLPAGDYQLSAAIDFTSDAALPGQDILGPDLVTGPASTITLQ